MVTAKILRKIINWYVMLSNISFLLVINVEPDSVS